MNIDSIDLDAYIQSIFLKNGPDKEDYLEFFEIVDQVKAEDIESFRNKIAPILNSATLFGFSYTKPFGYSGDFFIIEKIYQSYVNPDKRYKKWDIFLHSAPAVIAVVNRKTLAIGIFEKLNAKAMGLRQDVMILGSGPVTETFEFFEKNPENSLVFEMLDMDKRAIAYAKNKNWKYLSKMTFYNRNVIRYSPEKKYDLIWSAGLFDYFKGKHFVFLLKKYYEYLNEGGEMIIGNFNIENPSRRAMEILGDWFLYHRSADELKQFALQAGIEKSKIDVLKEPLGINLFLRIKK
ncbi:MAG: class I SAM-dependent methyltransferase [Prolixibacteraceae bacterium]|jgi:extracellular factor (EF) 3-hydroxypalmitic acid methyl ester biosynthesis protein|nr:class I SAM-dependent methyltransferase [Prolixibacteraceae bacterium]MBT6765276.1 class I SAM-dependent methyltransferase [Prolixibacteraceae bacterium]MBT6997792.1 class I SAM-dependent methyltransferase [Prolixibacteraceae bacterium]MBT7396803.1 class I SAM-dependent methyltransferase [Prolixibacteraceae bacterium]